MMRPSRAIRAIPAHLGETCQSVHSLIRRSGIMPRSGRWITGEEGDDGMTREALPGQDHWEAMRARASRGSTAGSVPVRGSLSRQCAGGWPGAVMLAATREA
jgi:hypothetical protein